MKCKTCGLLEKTIASLGRCGLKRAPLSNEECTHRAIGREFADALQPDVVIPGLERVGPLTATEMLAAREWFRRERLHRHAD